jgi:demethylmenaquinone methyltransferase/2-methoxy-6-polyprenyl-1,4-benzoquinol methylase
MRIQPTKKNVAPTKAEVAAHYDRYFSAVDRNDPAPALGQYWYVLAKRHLGNVRGLRVLEIGCGRGDFARYLAEAGAAVVAADLSPAAVAIARRRLVGTDATALVADIENIPFDDESFDVVVSLETLEHVPEPYQALSELVRVTRRGGRLVVTTPNYLSLYGLGRLYLWVRRKPFREAGEQPINHPLTLVQRVRALRRLGCRVEAADGLGHLLPLPHFGTVEIRILERPHRLTKWFALESVTAATRL